MADEREDQDVNQAPAAKEGYIQSVGRRENAAQPLSTDKDANAGADRYPDAPETRSFEPKVRNETAPGGDDVPPSTAQGRLGPGADPSEGKR